MKRIVRFNINENVRVRLTPEGFAIHKADYDEFIATLPLRVGESIPYRPPVIDADGFWTTQAWMLMKTFGRHLTMGREPPFYLTIEFEADL